MARPPEVESQAPEAIRRRAYSKQSQRTPAEEKELSPIEERKDDLFQSFSPKVQTRGQGSSPIAKRRDILGLISLIIWLLVLAAIVVVSVAVGGGV
jgi:hypothetical protein